MSRWIVSVLLFCAAGAWPAIASADPCRGQLPRTPDVSFTGEVQFVIDGDSLCVGAPGSKPADWIEVRIADFNAPRLQRGGDGLRSRRARRDARELMLHMPVTCRTVRGPRHSIRTQDEVYALCYSFYDEAGVGDVLRDNGVPERRRR